MNWKIIAIVAILLGVVWLFREKGTPPPSDHVYDDDDDETETDGPDGPDCSCGHKH